MTYSFKLCTLFGTEVRIDLTWFLILLIFIVPPCFNPDLSLGEALLSAIGAAFFLVSIYACVIGHEFVHVFAGRHFGVDTKRITIFIFGGTTHMDSIPFGFPEFIIGVVGPIFSFILGLGFLVIGGVTSDIKIVGEVLWFMGTLNLVLAGFNIVPIFPLDGGRVLRGLLYIKLRKPILSTKIVVVVGLCLSPFLYCFFIPFNMWTGILGIFIVMMALAELSTIKKQYRN